MDGKEGSDDTKTACVGRGETAGGKTVKGQSCLRKPRFEKESETIGPFGETF